MFGRRAVAGHRLDLNYGVNGFMRSHVGIAFDDFSLGLGLFFGEISGLSFVNKLMFFFFFRMYDLIFQHIQSFPSGSNLIFDLISFILADVPVQLKEFVQISANLSLKQLTVSLDKLQRKVSLLHRVHHPSVLNLKVSDQLDGLLFLEDAVDIAKLSPDYREEGWVVRVFYTFIDHINLIVIVEDMANEYEVPCSIEAIVGFVDLIH